MRKKRIIIAVTNDLVTDQRISRIAGSLYASGTDILLIGRLLPGSLPIGNRDYPTKRFKMIVKKGPFFYIFYNLRLFLFLLATKTDIVISNDLDTLLACFLASKLKNKPLIYDSHEYFTEVPELKERKITRKIWLILEKTIVPKIHFAYTVCDSLANIYQKKYHVPFHTIRNLPLKKETTSFPPLYETIKENKIIVYQGSINLGRGIEKIIKALPFLQNTVFLIIGRGDIEDEIRNLAEKMNVKDKVIFTGVIPYEQLHSYTQMGHLGISLEENICENYYYSLPNKIFDYIQAKVPLLTSSFPEINQIINYYEIGITTSEESPDKLSEIIHTMLYDTNQRAKWYKNLEQASLDLVWEKEQEKLIDFFTSHHFL